MNADADTPTPLDPGDRWATRLTAVARALPYPPTPRLAARIPRRAAPNRLVYAVALVVVLLLTLLAVPSTRAGLLQFIQIGVVRLQLGPTATPTPTATVPATATPAAATRTPVTTRPSAIPVTRTPRPSATPLTSVLDLAGATTLAEARAAVNFAIPLPAYPADLGAPTDVFVQDLEGQAVILVWRDPADPTHVRLTLHLLSAPSMVEKLIFSVYKEDPPNVIFTDVGGHTAVWTTGPYVLHTQTGLLHEYRLIEGHVLIWNDGRLTYRLETDLALDEAQRIAASLAD